MDFVVAHAEKPGQADDFALADGKGHVLRYAAGKTFRREDAMSPRDRTFRIEGVQFAPEHGFHQLLLGCQPRGDTLHQASVAEHGRPSAMFITSSSR